MVNGNGSSAISRSPRLLIAIHPVETGRNQRAVGVLQRNDKAVAGHRRKERGPRRIGKRILILERVIQSRHTKQGDEHVRGSYVKTGQSYSRRYQHLETRGVAGDGSNQVGDYHPI